MKYKIVYDGHSEEHVEFNCTRPDLAVRAYSEARIEAGGYSRAAVFAEPVAVIEKKKVSKKPKVEKSDLFRGYTAPVAVSIPCEKDGFVCETSTWIDSVEWEDGVGMTIHFLSGSHRVFNVTYHAFKTFKEYVAAGGSAGGYYNANFKRLDK